MMYITHEDNKVIYQAITLTQIMYTSHIYIDTKMLCIKEATQTLYACEINELLLKDTLLYGKSIFF